MDAFEFFVNFLLQTKIFFGNEKNEHLCNLSNENLNLLPANYFLSEKN